MSGTAGSALVLSGGGATAAYGVGAAAALLAGKSAATGGDALAPSIVAGTSSGAFNACYLAAAGDEAAAGAERLGAIWRDRLAAGGGRDGAYRFRLVPSRHNGGGGMRWAGWAGDGLAVGWDLLRRARLAFDGPDSPVPLLDLFHAGAFFDAEGWAAAVYECIDYRALRGAPARLQIAATNWLDGSVRLFGNRELADDLGADAVLASSAVPGLLAPVAIDGALYVDGSVRLNAPLMPAVRAGARTVHAVFLDTGIASRPPAEDDGTLRAFYRSLVIGWAAAMERDIARLRAYNRVLETVAGCACRADRRHALRAAIAALAELGEGEDPSDTDRDPSPITVHRYAPGNGFEDAEGFFDLRRDRIAAAIERGFAETSNHDCEASGCVLPGTAAGPKGSHGQSRSPTR